MLSIDFRIMDCTCTKEHRTQRCYRSGLAYDQVESIKAETVHNQFVSSDMMSYHSVTIKHTMYDGSRTGSAQTETNTGKKNGVEENALH